MEGCYGEVRCEAEKLLRIAVGCAIVKPEKGKPEKRPTLNNFTCLTLCRVSRHYCSSGGYFRFPLKI